MVYSNELENEHIMMKLRNNLDMKLFNLLGYDLEHHFYGDKNARGYTFYNKIKVGKDKSIYNIDFTFKILYEESQDIIRRYEKENISDEELDIELNRIKDIKYCAIFGLYITPQNTGMGSSVINCFIENLRKIEKIEKVFLSPKGKDAERFWSSLGFVKNDNRKISLRGISSKMVKEIN